MMTYEMECTGCENRFEVRCPISEHAKVVKPERRCAECGGVVRQVITEAYKGHASREPFPKGMNESIAPDPIYVRDKIHARDLGQQYGTGSKWVDNDF